jgi:hypothetical protein
MNKEDNAEAIEKLNELIDKGNKRNYKYRDMILSIKSVIDDSGFSHVTGRLIFGVSENDPDKLDFREFEVMSIDKVVQRGIDTVISQLTAIPNRFGDAMFEEDFFEILKDAEKKSLH